MIKITVLASGSKGNCYVINDGKSKLMVECGLSIKEIKKALGFGLSDISFALLSHCHGDHSKAAKDIVKAGIDMYTSQGTIDALGLSSHRVHAVKAREQFSAGTWTILPLEAQHDAPEPVGFLLQSRNTSSKLLFLTDSFYCRYRFKSLTHIMVECNYAADILDANVKAGTVPVAMKKRIMRSHFSLENVKEFLKANDLSRVRQIWLLHLSDGNSDAERFKREIQGLTGKEVYVCG